MRRRHFQNACPGFDRLPKTNVVGIQKARSTCCDYRLNAIDGMDLVRVEFNLVAGDVGVPRYSPVQLGLLQLLPGVPTASARSEGSRPDSRRAMSPALH